MVLHEANTSHVTKLYLVYICAHKCWQGEQVYAHEKSELEDWVKEHEDFMRRKQENNGRQSFPGSCSFPME